MTGIRTLPIGLALGSALLLGGCAEEPGEETSTPVPTTEAPSTSEPDPTTIEAPTDDAEPTTAPPELSAHERDQVDIEKTLEEYTRALNDAFNGDASVEGIYPFSRDVAREQWITEVMAAQAQGVVFSGSTEMEVLEIAVDGDDATALACLDVSTVEAVDEDGNSIIAEDRLDRTLQDFVLERDDSAEAGWYVVDDTNRNEPCNG